MRITSIITLQFLLLGIFLQGELGAQILMRGPYLQSLTQESIIVRWRTDSAANSVVNYGTTQGVLSQTASNPTLTTEHSVQINGLDPSTVYYYEFGSTTLILGGNDSLHHFKTAPIPGTEEKFRFWALGDFGKDNAPQAACRDAFLDYNAKHDPVDFWIWLGDNAYDTGTDFEYQTKVFGGQGHYNNIFPWLPFYPSPGNHDYGSVNLLDPPDQHTGPYYDIVDVFTQAEMGGKPSTMEAFFSYDYANVHFISINSEINTWIATGNTPFTQWLEQDLQANKQKWTIAYWHQPPYSKGSHSSDDFWELVMLAMRTNIVPILEQYGVDLVLCGHSHVYERSYLIRGHTGFSFTFGADDLVDGSSGKLSLGEPYVKDTVGPEAGKGTVYVVNGAGGSNQESPALDHPAMYYGYGCLNCAGSMVVEVRGDTLQSWFIASDSTIKDDFTMIKSGPVGRENTEEKLVQSLSVWPNPFQRFINIHYVMSRSAVVSLELFDLQGKEVAKLDQGLKHAGVNSFKLYDEGNELTPGNYLLKLSSSGVVLAKQIIKIH